MKEPLLFSGSRPAGDVLEKRLNYEKMVSDISFRAVTVEDINEFLKDCLNLMGNCLDVSRIYIFEHCHETDTMNNTFEWVAPGVTPQKDDLQGIPSSVAPWWMAKMKDNQIINYRDIEDIPGEKEKEILRGQDIKSVLVVPLYVGKKYYGFIGFDECRYHRDWPVEDVNLLNTVTRIISGAIERKQTERALRESEERYRSLFENSKDMFFIASKDGGFIDINPSAVSLLGYSKEELMALKLENLFVNPSIKKKLLANIRRRGFVKDFPLNIRKKDGTVISVLVTIALRKVDLAEDNYEFQGIVRDITERKKARKALAAEKERLAVTLRSIGDGVITTDMDGKIILINKIAEEITGWSQEEVAGKFLSEVFRSSTRRRRAALGRGPRKETPLVVHGRLQTGGGLCAKPCTR